MATEFSTRGQQELFERVMSELRGLGYKDELLQEDYDFQDWFSTSASRVPDSVTADAAAFGRLPLGDDNACFAVAVTGKLSGSSLISRYRSLGAPLALEVAPDRVNCWSVRANGLNTSQPIAILPERLRDVFVSHLEDWSPAAVLRAKNIVASPTRPQQVDFIDVGLMPALEGHILDKLDPLLRRTFFAAMDTYKRHKDAQPAPGKLFRLVFRILAGKIMTDKGMPKFKQFMETPDPNELLSAVNQHFGDAPKLIADAETRRVVVDRLWSAFNLRNISAAVLSLIWENTLVDPDIRKSIGLYGTPPAIARYMVQQVGLDDLPEGERTVVEPCCGNGVFLLAAMKRLTELLDAGNYTPSQRHTYLKKMLSGFDIDPFGLEVARDCLMLADFPNSNGWVLGEEDVLDRPELTPGFSAKLRDARIVLCNPPFAPRLSDAQRLRYEAESTSKPAVLLDRLLTSCPNLRGLGFVMPHQLLAGKAYRDVRSKLASRFGSLEIVSLPKSGVFTKVNYEVVILIATRPRTPAKEVALTHRKLSALRKPLFANTPVNAEGDRALVKVTSASKSIAVPDLYEVWSYLRDYSTIKSVTQPLERRGIQWNKSLETHQHLLIVDYPQSGYMKGFPSAPGKVLAYLPPPAKYLSVKDADKYRNAFDLPWDQPKVVMNSNRRGGGHPWRIAAFGDRSGALAVHTYMAFWPTDGWSPELLAAVLNGPLANAYVTTHATGRHLLNRDVDAIPVPIIDTDLKVRIERLVSEYVAIMQAHIVLSDEQRAEALALLLDIDASVLKGYRLPPRLERKLLNLFNGHGNKRPVGFPVGDYFPVNFPPMLPLRVYLSPDFKKSTAKNLLAVAPSITDNELIAALTEVE